MSPPVPRPTSSAVPIAPARPVAPAEAGQPWLNGRKHLITNAREAELFAVFCFTEETPGGDRGFSVLLVQRGTPGFTIEPLAPTMGCSGASHDLLIFENVPVPVAQVLGRPGMGAEQLLAFLEISRVFIAVSPPS